MYPTLLGPFYLWQQLPQGNRVIIPMVIRGAFDLLPPPTQRSSWVDMNICGKVTVQFLSPIRDDDVFNTSLFTPSTVPVSTMKNKNFSSKDEVVMNMNIPLPHVLAMSTEQRDEWARERLSKLLRVRMLEVCNLLCHHILYINTNIIMFDMILLHHIL